MPDLPPPIPAPSPDPLAAPGGCSAGGGPSSRVSAYTVCPTGFDEVDHEAPGGSDKWDWDLTVEDRGLGWAVRHRGRVLNRDGGWELEPGPSRRDEEFLSRCRFEHDEALTLALAAVDSVVVAGLTFAQYRAWAAALPAD